MWRVLIRGATVGSEEDAGAADAPLSSATSAPPPPPVFTRMGSAGLALARVRADALLPFEP